MTNCLLCKREVSPSTVPSLFLHEDSPDCLVRVTDDLGVSVDDRFEVEGEVIYHRTTPEEEAEQAIELVQFTPIEQACKLIFAEAGLDRLGGQSTGSGWSNVGLFQRCR